MSPSRTACARRGFRASASRTRLARRICMSVALVRIETMSPADLLAFEAAHPAFTPEKDAQIRRELGITPTRYVVLLGRAAASPEGIAADPITARRVREQAESRAAARERRAA